MLPLLILGTLAIICEISYIITWVFGGRPFYAPRRKYKVSVIVPCKGKGKDLEDNIKAILNQEYDSYEVILVLDSKEDPAYSILRAYKKIVISKVIPTCSGKISALITGIKHAKDAEVYVFADSDIKPPKDWLLYLTSALGEEGVGATTGYRYYLPYNLKSLLLSTWNTIGSTSLLFPLFNFAWGGSTAIKREVFEKLGIEREWKKGLSDDLILTKKVKEAGYKIKFIPQCLVPSSNEISFIGWGTRQFTWVKWYYKSAWLVSFIGMVCLKLVTCLGFPLLLFGYTIPGLLMISTIPLEMICGWQAAKKLSKITSHKFNSLSFAFMTPIAFFLLAYNCLASCFKREIKWGGRIYRKI
jgi:cellulose synthase/poly-beta-1,6-N-acetylglucosamine synthase-like glycosyltransferase